MAFKLLLFPFSNLENYGIMNVCVCSKSKIKKVTNKQNLERFKMINRRFFIRKFCNSLKMFLSFSWVISIRAGDNFSLFEYLCFSFLLIFRFILIWYTRLKTEKQLCYHKDWEASILVCYLLWYNKSQWRSLLTQLKTTVQWLRKFKR